MNVWEEEQLVDIVCVCVCVVFLAKENRAIEEGGRQHGRGQHALFYHV